MDKPHYFFSDLLMQSDATLFSIVDLLLVMLVTTLLCFLLAHTYRSTHRGPGYSQALLVTMFMMGIATGTVMLIIGSNIARAFSLVGALSIIRFRTAVKDPRDTGFLFVAIVAGMGCGTQFYAAAILMTAFICVLLKILFYLDYGIDDSLDVIVRVTSKESVELEKRISDVLSETCGGPPERLNRITEIEDGHVTSVFLFRNSKETESNALEVALKEIDGVVRYAVYQTDHHAPI